MDRDIATQIMLHLGRIADALDKVTNAPGLAGLIADMAPLIKQLEAEGKI